MKMKVLIGCKITKYKLDLALPFRIQATHYARLVYLELKKCHVRHRLSVSTCTYRFQVEGIISMLQKLQ